MHSLLENHNPLDVDLKNRLHVHFFFFFQLHSYTSLKKTMLRVHVEQIPIDRIHLVSFNVSLIQFVHEFLLAFVQSEKPSQHHNKASKLKMTFKKIDDRSFFFRGHLCVFFVSLCSFKVFLRSYIFVDWFDVSRLKYFLVRELQIGFFISFPFGLDRFCDGSHDLSVALPSNARKMYLWCKRKREKKNSMNTTF